jgi:hypothetical protein
MHIYEDPAKYPPRPDTYYAPPDVTFADGRTMLRTMGFDRVNTLYSKIEQFLQQDFGPRRVPFILNDGVVFRRFGFAPFCRFDRKEWAACRIG